MLQVDVYFLRLPPGFQAVPHYFNHEAVGPDPLHNDLPISQVPRKWNVHNLLRIASNKMLPKKESETEVQVACKVKTLFAMRSLVGIDAEQAAASMQLVI